MIYAGIPAEARCDEPGCTAKPVKGEFILGVTGAFNFTWRNNAFGPDAWQLAPDQAGNFVTFCKEHRKETRRLVQMGPAGLNNPNPSLVREH